MSSLQIAHFTRWTNLQEKCSRESCHVTTLRNSILARRGGIRLVGRWFCGPECFQEELEDQIRLLIHRPGPHLARRPSRIPLELLLVSRGWITNMQLQQARERQVAEGGHLPDILRRLQLVTERQLADAAALQWGCPVYAAGLRPEAIEARIPAVILRAAAMAPVFQEPRRNRLLMGFVYRVEHQILRTIEDMTSCLSEPCFITASECEEQIRRLTSRNLEVEFERPSSATEIASIVRSYAGQIGAEDARLALCQNHIWARLLRNDHPTDLLFAVAVAP